MDTLPNVLQGNQNLSLEMSDEECPEKTRAPISAPEHGSDIADEGREDLSVGCQELTNRSAVANCGTTGEALSSTTERAELKQHDNVRNEEDFEVKKEERKETIDTVQGDEEAFKLCGNKNVNVISQSAGTRIREIFHRGGFNVS